MDELNTFIKDILVKLGYPSDLEVYEIKTKDNQVSHYFEYNDYYRGNNYKIRTYIDNEMDRELLLCFKSINLNEEDNSFKRIREKGKIC